MKGRVPVLALIIEEIYMQLVPFELHGAKCFWKRGQVVEHLFFFLKLWSYDEHLFLYLLYDVDESHANESYSSL